MTPQRSVADDTLRYFHVVPEAPLVELGWNPTHIVVIADISVRPDWQAEVSDWMLAAGCRYMMAWGPDSSSWDDSMDYANLNRFLPADIPDEYFVITTWHRGDTLPEVFWYAKYSAQHPGIRHQRTLLLHISMTAQPGEMLHAFSVA